jgi:hypothetical protein
MRWYPQGSRLGLWAIYFLAALYVLMNLFVFAMIWLPSNLQKALNSSSPILPSFLGPTVGISCYAAGALYWVWDRKILKALGYRLEPLKERQEGNIVRITFNVRPTLIPLIIIYLTVGQRHVTGVAATVILWMISLVKGTRRAFGRSD